MLHDVVSVKVGERYRLYIEFDDGEIAQYVNYAGILPYRHLDVSSNSGVHMYSFGFFHEYDKFSCFKCMLDKNPLGFKE